MANKARVKSVTGIYHVMVRGINKQTFFFDDDDYMCMQRVLADAHVRRENGKIVSEKDCSIYAYCIMDNHVHILIRAYRRFQDTVTRLAAEGSCLCDTVAQCKHSSGLPPKFNEL